MSRFLFYMGHPAHYHNFKNVIHLLEEKGHKVMVVARGKDVLFDLVDSENWNLVKLPGRKPSGRMSLVINVLRREVDLLRIARRWKPDLMAGTDLTITHIGKFLRIPSVVVNEDDSAAVPLLAKYAFPFATRVLAPDCCDQSPANHKKIGYPGYHELAYLHPRYFHPNRSLLPIEVRSSEHYFILRFASLHAHHDKGKRGISNELAHKLIDLLSKKGDVFITSERELPPSLEAFRLPVHPSLIHHVMAFADIYIGDSQTMAAEAAVLGVPSIRFNDFVGKLSYLEELEHRYELTRGISTTEENKLLLTVEDWLGEEFLREKFQNRRKELLNSTVDVTQFWFETFTELAETHGEM